MNVDTKVISNFNSHLCARRKINWTKFLARALNSDAKQLCVCVCVFPSEWSLNLKS